MLSHHHKDHRREYSPTGPEIAEKQLLDLALHCVELTTCLHVTTLCTDIFENNN